MGLSGEAPTTLRGTMGGIRHSIAILFLAAASLLAFSRHRFASRAVEDVSVAARRPAISPRVALVVLDGMRDDRFRALMYYSAPIVLVVLFARLRLDADALAGTVTAAAALCLLRLAAMLVGFVWGGLASGSWTVQLTEALLLSTWALALLMTLPLVCGVGERRATSGVSSTRAAGL